MVYNANHLAEKTYGGLASKKISWQVDNMREISEQDVSRIEGAIAVLNDVLAMLAGAFPDLPPEIAIRVAERLKRNVCLQCQKPLADEKRESRGCCERCYGRIYQQVSRHKTTWTKAILEGKVTKEINRGGRPLKNPLLSEIEGIAKDFGTKPGTLPPRKERTTRKK